MSMTIMQQMAVLPAVLVALSGVLILQRADEGKRLQRFLLSMLWIGVLFLAALVISARFLTSLFDQPFFQLSRLLVPSVVGVLALVLINIRALASMSPKMRIMAAILGLAMFVLFGLLWGSQGVEYLIFPGALLLAVGWALGKRYDWLAVALAMLCLGGLFLNNWFMSHPPDYTTVPSSFAVVVLYLLGFYLWPGLAVVISGVLVATGLQTLGDNHRHTRARWTSVFLLVLAFLLIIYLAYTIFWGSVWDQTDDGLFGVLLSQLTGIIAIGVGMVMMVVLWDKKRLAGIVFMLLVPVAVYQSFETGWQVSYHELTEKRAIHIVKALDRFQAREGYYPETLDALTPRDLPLVQHPVILAGEEWCYQGGEDFYRLAAYYREFFSSPVSLRVYAAAGEPPEKPWECEARLAAMKERYYSPMEDPEAMRPPLPTPLPTIDVGMPKIPISPVLEGVLASPGSWSADGAYFVFGAQNDPPNGALALHFLNGKTGEICTADGRFTYVEILRDHHAWLPDGRLMYVDSTGDLTIHIPCQPGVERLTDSFPEMFSRIAANAPETGRVLLQSASAYWILDGHTLTTHPIPDVAPNPYEFHWDRAVWLPGGERLAINRLNGRQDSGEGATLYLIDGGTGQVENSLPLAGDFGQSAPWIEGLSDHELLLHDSGDLVVANFSANPVRLTSVLADLFGLGIDYPDEVSSSGSFLNASGYYLAVRLNHPRNQSIYLYHSETGRVYVYDHINHTLLLFPDGQLMELSKWDGFTLGAGDDYDVILSDALDVVQPRLVITGHVPREYPHLSLRYLPNMSQIAVASAHGVSLVSLPGGELVAYWDLIGEGFSPSLLAAPDGSALVAAKDFGGLYYIPLP